LRSPRKAFISLRPISQVKPRRWLEVVGLVKDPEKVNDVIVFVEKKDDGFSFEISDEYGTMWYVYQHPKNNEDYFVIERFEIESFWVTEAKQFRYAEFGVKNLFELYQKFLQNPDKLIWKLTKLKKHVTKVRTDDEEVKIDSNRPIEINDINDEENVNEEEWWSIYAPHEYDLEDRDWTLVIEKYNKGFRFYLKGEPSKRSWLIEQSDKYPDMFAMSFEQNLKEIVTVKRSYSNYEAKDLWDLYRLLVEEPSRYFYFLTGVSAPIKQVKVVSHTSNNVQEVSAGEG
jgi:hypothetical protein